MKEYLNDKQLSELIALMLNNPVVKNKVNEIIRDKSFLKYNNKELTRLFWGIIFDRKEIIEEYKDKINVNGTDPNTILKLLTNKYALFKFKKILPILLRPKETEDDLKQLRQVLEKYLTILSFIDLPTFDKVIDARNNEILDNFKNIKKISSGFSELDNLIGGGFYAGRTYLFAGGTGQGKSTVLRSLAINTAKNKFKTLFITLEMSAIEVGYLISKSVDKSIFNYLTIVEDMDGNWQAIPSLINVYTPDILFIDYLDEYSPADWKVMSDVIKFIRYYSKIYNIPIVTACQLNRMGYNELIPDDMKISSLSGSFEKVKKSEFVGLLSFKKDVLKIKVLKNRWGENNVVLQFVFNKNKMIIEEANAKTR